MSQEQVKKTSSKSDSVEEEVETVEAKDLSNEELTDDVEKMLEDIDEALGDLTEEEIQTFVESFVQGGGQ